MLLLRIGMLGEVREVRKDVRMAMSFSSQSDAYFAPLGEELTERESPRGA